MMAWGEVEIERAQRIEARKQLAKAEELIARQDRRIMEQDRKLAQMRKQALDSGKLWADDVLAILDGEDK